MTAGTLDRLEPVPVEHGTLDTRDLAAAPRRSRPTGSEPGRAPT